MTKSEVAKLIAEKVTQSRAILREAEALADEHGLDFSIDPPAYGMGGWYVPKTEVEENGYNSDFCELTETGGYWRASSTSC